MTKQNGNCFANAYHDLVKASDKMSKQAYDMIYQTLNIAYEQEIGKARG